MEQISLKISGGQTIYGNCWKVDPKTESKGNIVICHGMCEYSARYDEFAKYLNSKGYDVYAVDHPGHGLNVTIPENPSLGLGVWPNSGFKLAIEYLHSLIVEVRLTMKPIILLGHSMGSIVCQRYFQRYSNTIDGLILSGSFTNHPSLVCARILSQWMAKFLPDHKKERPSKFFYKLQMASYNKFKPYADGYNSASKFLQVNEENVKKYDMDPMCGFIPSFNFYFNLFGGMKPTFQKKRLKDIENKVPVLLIAGDKDPVGKMGKSVKKLAKFYTKGGIETDTHLYEGYRHEILFDDCKQQVFEDCLNYIDSQVNKALQAKSEEKHDVNKEVFE